MSADVRQVFLSQFQPQGEASASRCWAGCSPRGSISRVAPDRRLHRDAGLAARVAGPGSLPGAARQALRRRPTAMRTWSLPCRKSSRRPGVCCAHRRTAAGFGCSTIGTRSAMSWRCCRGHGACRARGRVPPQRRRQHRQWPLVLTRRTIRRADVSLDSTGAPTHRLSAGRSAPLQKSARGRAAGTAAAASAARRSHPARRSTPGPARVVQECAGQRHHVGLAIGDDLLGLGRVGDQADRHDRDAHLGLHGSCERHLVAGGDRDLLLVRHAADEMSRNAQPAASSACAIAIVCASPSHPRPSRSPTGVRRPQCLAPQRPGPPRTPPAAAACGSRAGRRNGRCAGWDSGDMN